MEAYVKSTIFNSSWSVWYCMVVLGVQSYITYREIVQYLTLRQLPWQDGSAPPPELTSQMVLVVLSILYVPLFVLACILRTGNYANDGTKLGRDHALNSNFETLCRPFRNSVVRRVWRHFCPLAQTLHLTAALCLLLPETLISAAVAYHSHRDKDAIWMTDLDFLFSPRKLYGVGNKANINLSAAANSTESRLLEAILPEQPVSVAFVNFAAALFAFSARYSAVFWYTNKLLSCIFAMQLLWMTVHSLFAFCGMTVLYKVAVNSWINPKIILILPPSVILILYVAGGFILLLSTMTIFEYGLYYFEEKFKLIQHRHHSSFAKDAPRYQSSCHGYIPHSCAMVTLVFLAACKGPITYDLVTVYRLTRSKLILTCVIIDVCYMVFWIAFWSVLTLKQTWRFRILDYVPAGQAVFMLQNDHIVRNPSFDHIELAEYNRRKRRQRGGSVQSMDFPTSESGDTDTVGTLDEDIPIAQLPPIAENPDVEQNPMLPNGVLVRKMKNRKNGAQRVTFDESVIAVSASEDENNSKATNMTAENGSQSVSAVVHNSSPDDATVAGIEAANTHQIRKSIDISVPYSEPKESCLTRDYCNDLRNKCGEYFTNKNKLSPNMEEPLASIVKISAESDDDTAIQTPTALCSIDVAKADRNQSNLEVVDPAAKQMGEEAETTGMFSSKNEEKRLTTFKDSPFHSNKPRFSAVSLSNGSAFHNSHHQHTNKPDIVPNDSNSKLFSRPIHLIVKKPEIVRRDSANYSMTSSQDNSSNDSEHGLCSQNPKQCDGYLIPLDPPSRAPQTEWS